MRGSTSKRLKSQDKETVAERFLIKMLVVSFFIYFSSDSSSASTFILIFSRNCLLQRLSREKQVREEKWLLTWIIFICLGLGTSSCEYLRFRDRNREDFLLDVRASRPNFFESFSSRIYSETTERVFKLNPIQPAFLSFSFSLPKHNPIKPENASERKKFNNVCTLSIAST